MLEAVNSVVAKRMYEAGELVGDIEFSEGRVSMLGRGNFANRLLIDTVDGGESSAIVPIWGTSEHTHTQDILNTELPEDKEDLIGMLEDAGIWTWEEGGQVFTKFSQSREGDGAIPQAQITGAVMWHPNDPVKGASFLTVITNARSFQVNIKP